MTVTACDDIQVAQTMPGTTADAALTVPALHEPVLEKGYFQVYTGDGKGKTTAVLGLTVRAVGAGMRVYIGQFLKTSVTSEAKSLVGHFPEVTVEEYGNCRSMSIGSADEGEDGKPSAFERIAAVLLSGEYDMVVLDEINIAVYFNLISEQEALELIELRPENVELVFTGRRALPSFIERADLVSEVVEVKHYYHQGVPARRGIEY